MRRHGTRLVDYQEPIHTLYYSDLEIALWAGLHQREELGARVLLLEDSDHSRGHGRGVLLLHPPHHHAQVPGLDHHAHSLGINRILNGIGDLPCKPLLHLQAPGKDLHQPGYLAQADHLALRDVGHVDLAEKRQHVMLAKRENLDISHDHHLVVVHIEQSAAQNLRRILAVTLSEKSHRLRRPGGRFQQAITLRVFAQTSDQLGIKILGGISAQSPGNKRLTNDCWMCHAFPLPHIRRNCFASLPPVLVPKRREQSALQADRGWRYIDSQWWAPHA